MDKIGKFLQSKSQNMMFDNIDEYNGAIDEGHSIITSGNTSITYQRLINLAAKKGYWFNKENIAIPIKDITSSYARNIERFLKKSGFEVPPEISRIK